jgi:predicted component of type VI protein secretion system
VAPLHSHSSLQPIHRLLSGLAVDGDPKWPRSAVSGAIARAIAEFAAAEAVDPGTAAELEREATAGAQDAIDALLCFDERAKRQVGYLLGMAPAYWEPAEISPEFRALLEKRTSAD